MELRTAEKLRFGSKSNKETPKNIHWEGLTTLRGPLINSLEFPYCFFDEKTEKFPVWKTPNVPQNRPFSSQKVTLHTVLEVSQANRRNRTKVTKRGPFLRHLFPVFCQKRREGKGVGKVLLKTRSEKSVKSMFFRVRPF